ncbi:hypothetical protein P167DRAFT_565872 [Morchella conica CCBAS932]|uniref:Uncharacterized protein n=1 Tax=Morchella conica CCBAS932 TaxID=1392247 RepID=A0A3N4KLW0_9PEZI|nr:hypothetical protein P167DRAFT_565872 [Morchella conica CCBAS932]
MGSCISIRRRRRFEDVFPVIFEELELQVPTPGPPIWNPAWQPIGNPAWQPVGNPTGQPSGNSAAPETTAAPGSPVENVGPSPPELSGESPWEYNGNPTDGAPGYYRGKDLRAKARRKKHYRQQRGGLDGEDGEGSSGPAAVEDDGVAKSTHYVEQPKASGAAEGSGETRAGITRLENDVANPPKEHTSPATTPGSSNEGTLSKGSWVDSDRTHRSPYFNQAQAELARALISGTGRASITRDPTSTARPDSKTRHIEEDGEADRGSSAEDGPTRVLEDGGSPSGNHTLTKQTLSMGSNSALDGGESPSLTDQSTTARPGEAAGDIATTEREPSSGSSEINTTEPSEALGEGGLNVTTQSSSDNLSSDVSRDEECISEAKEPAALGSA